MHRLIIISLAIAALLCGAAAQAKAEQLYATDDSGFLLSFDSATPGTVVSRPIGGLGADNLLIGIDFRPSNGMLYGITGRQQVFTINPLTAQATFVSTLTTRILSATGMDFDPIEDRLRVITQSGQNLRINVDTGEVMEDGSINPVNPQISGAAYTFVGATTSTLYGIGTATDSLYTINPATGTITLVGGLGVDTLNAVGFDISGQTGIAYAALTTMTPTDRFSSLYTINLATGQATLVGQIGTGFGFRITGLMTAPAGGSAPIPEPATVVLLSTGLIGVSAAMRKRRIANKRHKNLRVLGG